VAKVTEGTEESRPGRTLRLKRSQTPDVGARR